VTDKVIVYTTCGNATEAEALARDLIDNRLAACVNVIPGLLSYYRWQGKIENDAELMMMIKTSRHLLGEVHATLDRMHSYELPEMIVVPILDGSTSYLDWMDQELRAPDEDEPEQTPSE